MAPLLLSLSYTHPPFLLLSPKNTQDERRRHPRFPLTHHTHTHTHTHAHTNTHTHTHTHRTNDEDTLAYVAQCHPPQKRLSAFDAGGKPASSSGDGKKEEEEEGEGEGGDKGSKFEYQEVSAGE